MPKGRRVGKMHASERTEVMAPSQFWGSLQVGEEEEEGKEEGGAQPKKARDFRLWVQPPRRPEQGGHFYR